MTTWYGSAEAKGHADETRAKDPALALARALDLQPRLLDATIRASGIHKLVALRSQIQAILDRSTVESDFVDLPNATFDRLTLDGPQESDPVDLGFVGQYSKNPGRKYATKRYSQTSTKRFRFAMPLRADVSLIQPGYRMEVGRESIEVIPFANAPAGGGPAPRFPTAPISRTFRWENSTVYDVYQSEVFSEADEDEFEGADPGAALGPFAREGLLAPYSYATLMEAFSTPSKFDLELTRPKTKPERLFLNERPGYCALKVDIAFDADLTSPDYPFVGHATVTLTSLDPERFREGVILPITVYETRIDADGQRDEWMADRMTVHIVGGFLTVENAYFTDRREGMAAIDSIFGSINEKYTRYEPDLPVGPEWRMRRRYMADEAKVNSLRRFLEDSGPEAANALQRFKVPQTGR